MKQCIGVPRVVFLPSFVSALIQEGTRDGHNRWKEEAENEEKSSRPPIQPQRKLGRLGEEENLPPRFPRRSCSPEPGRRAKVVDSVNLRTGLDHRRSSIGLEAALAA